MHARWKERDFLKNLKLPWDSMCVESCTPWAEGEGKTEAFPPPEVVQVIVILWVHDFNSNM
jgi:hypothetical protein